MATNINLPIAGDIIQIKGSKAALLVISANPTQSVDDMRGDVYRGYSFSTIKIDDINKSSPTEKTWTIDLPQFSLGGPNMVKPEAIRTIQTGLNVVKNVTYSIDLKFIGQTSQVGA